MERAVYGVNIHTAEETDEIESERFVLYTRLGADGWIVGRAEIDGKGGTLPGAQLATGIPTRDAARGALIEALMKTEVAESSLP